jgi:predicted dienelactone hydrolase
MKSFVKMGMCALFALTAACGSDATTTASAKTDVSSDGTTSDSAAFDSGYADTLVYTDTSGVDAAVPTLYGVGVLDIKVAGPGGRSLPTTIWYPIPAGTQGTPIKYLGMMASPNGAIAKADAAQGPFALVAFSHGNQGLRQQSVFLTEALAQHGYVVIAPDHVGNTFMDYDAKLLGAMVVWRPLDLRAAIDRALKPEAGDPAWLAGLVDPKHIAVSGHSFGGYTALAAAGAPVSVPAAYLPDCSLPGASSDTTCQAMALAGSLPWKLGDPRVSLVLPLAHCGQLPGFGFVLPMLADLKIPAIFQAATGDTTCTLQDQAQPAYDAWGGPKALLVMQGGNHFSYSDMCSLPLAQTAQFAAYCKGRVPELSVAHEAIVHYTLAACDAWLRGQTAAKQEFQAGPAGILTIQSSGIAP